ncbi:ParB/RepB/Spo0J family partition protein [Streptomyces halobius]|uniref:ParB N-terminal domain-containing protein n=1 Tax=Streptomyces halobius TaxID=2879846 RepID=A0ABY4M7B7_9ACTN|nr:ParB N-terminal domain-containing protein [Streptomyces halobius]UQA93665.1 ParB N-terminal domain-containing protein [Streptomyces halobius]
MTVIETEVPPTAADIKAEATPEAPIGIEGFAGTFAWVDPRTLVVDPYNHRKPRPSTGEDEAEECDDQEAEDTTEPDADLIASVDGIGVQTPLLLRPQADGETLGIIFGQRRFKAALLAAEKAIAAGRPFRLVPAIVRTDLKGIDDDALTISLIENKHRKAASVRDDIDAVRQLSLMKISKTRKAKHARSLGLTPEQVKAAETADKLSDESLSKALSYDFDFVELADLHEVEDLDHALRWLRSAKHRDLDEGEGQRGNWAHTMQKLRDQKADQAAREQLTEELATAGIPLVERSWNWAKAAARPLTDLTTTDGNLVTPEDHRSCPGHAAFLDRDEPVAVWLCQDWMKCGHKLGPDAPKDAREHKDKEAEKEARRTVIRNNKAWRAARVVRHEFLATLCTRKGDASPASWTLIMSTITGTSYLYEHFVDTGDTTLTATFLRVPDPNEDRNKWTRVSDPFAEVIAKTPASRRWQILLALVCAAHEQQSMGDSVWRGEIGSHTAAWLAFLKAEGYAPSEIEAETLATAEAQAQKRAEALAAAEAEKRAAQDAEPVAA